MRQSNSVTLPSKTETIRFTKILCISLFPSIEGGQQQNFTRKKIKKQLLRLLKPMQSSLSGDRHKLTELFTGLLPEVKEKLEADAKFILENDPAATCLDEVIMTYPGFYAILVYRLANSLQKLKIPLIPRIMTEYAHSVTGVDIHPGATIGNKYFIDHGTGIVVGETSVIGDRVKIYQGVTIGALSVNKHKAAAKRHPTIEDDVIIYAGSTILGGETTIGHDSIIGGNVWLTKSIPPYSLVQHESKVNIRKRKHSLNQ